MTSQFQRRHEKRAAKCAKISSHPMGDWDPFPNGPLGEVGGVSVLDTLIAGYNPSAGRGLLAGSDYTFKVGCLCLNFWKGVGHIEVTMKGIEKDQMMGVVNVYTACLVAIGNLFSPLPGVCTELGVYNCVEAALGIFPDSSPTAKITGC